MASITAHKALLDLAPACFPPLAISTYALAMQAFLQFHSSLMFSPNRPHPTLALPKCCSRFPGEPLFLFLTQLTLLTFR